MAEVPVAVIFDGPLAPPGGGAATRFHNLACHLTSIGFPVTFIHCWRGWSDLDLLSAQPYQNILVHPNDIYSSSGKLIDGGYQAVITKSPTILKTLQQNSGIIKQASIVFDCHDLPRGDR